MKRIVTTLVVVTTFVIACKKDKTPPSMPTITTSTLTNITISGAVAGGVITSDGGATITKSGIVWSKTNNTPTITDSVVSGTATSGSFTVNLTKLDFGTTYYIRAFATNSVGTAYGDAVTLATTNDDTKVRFTYNGATVTYGVITSTTTGKKWMDRNLGSSAVATSLTDTAGYGHYFQWGRLADGHQLITSGTTNALSSTDNPGNSNYIIPPGSPRDWRSPQNDNLWQGSNGVNNPCPTGWHVPTKVEWEAENITDPATAYSRLKLAEAGYRSYFTPTTLSPNSAGQEGLYWTSTTESTDSYEFAIYPSNMGPGTLRRGNACSVRCIKD
jgi:hypothetical protein